MGSDPQENSDAVRFSFLAATLSTLATRSNNTTYGVTTALLSAFCFCQTLREEKNTHETEMSHVRARSEEEARQLKESQARALEELAKKHRVTLENALNSAEKDKNRLLAVRTHTHTHTPYTNHLTLIP